MFNQGTVFNSLNEVETIVTTEIKNIGNKLSDFNIVEISQNIVKEKDNKFIAKNNIDDKDFWILAYKYFKFDFKS